MVKARSPSRTSEKQCNRALPLMKSATKGRLFKRPSDLNALARSVSISVQPMSARVVSRCARIWAVGHWVLRTSCASVRFSTRSPGCDKRSCQVSSKGSLGAESAAGARLSCNSNMNRLTVLGQKPGCVMGWFKRISWIHIFY